MKKLPSWYNKQLQDADEIEKTFKKLERAVMGYVNAVRDKIRNPDNLTYCNSDQREHDKCCGAIEPFEKKMAELLEITSKSELFDKMTEVLEGQEW